MVPLYLIFIFWMMLSSGITSCEKVPPGDNNLWKRDVSDDRPLLMVQTGHGNVVSSVAFSPDGNFVLTGSYDGTARLWIKSTGHEIKRFEGHLESVTSVAFSPDGKMVITGGWDRTARLWNIATGKEMRRFEGHLDWIKSVSFSPDGHLVLTGGADNTARVWDLTTGLEIRRFSGHSNGIESCAFSPDGRFVLTGGNDGTARLWDAETGREIRRFSEHSGELIMSVVFSHDGRFILTGGSEGNDGIVMMWDVEKGRLIRRFSGHSGTVTSVTFSPNGAHVLTGGKDDTARLWDLATGGEIYCFKGHGETITSVAFSPDGEMILTGNWYNTASLWQIASRKEIRRFDGDSGIINSARFSHDGRFVLTGGWDNKAHLWDTTTGGEIRRIEGHSDWITAVSFSPNGRFVLTGSTDGTARLWHAATGREVRRFGRHLDSVSSVAFSQDGRFVLTGSIDNHVRMWDVLTGGKIRQFGILSGPDNPVAFSPDGCFVLAGFRSTDEHIARLWNSRTGKEIRQFTGHTSDISSVVFSPDGRFILTSSLDGTARLWDALTAKEIRRFAEGKGPVSSSAFSPDGRFVLTDDGNNDASLWNMDTGKKVRRFKGHHGNISSVMFSADGRYILTGSHDSTTRIWDAVTGKEMASLISFRNGTWVVVAPDGRFDTNNLEEIKGLHWIMPDDPMRALPVEIFMRDYYEPRLLPRILAGETFKPVRPLTELNRMQPKVEIKDVQIDDVNRGTVTVTVEISGAEGNFVRNGKSVSLNTGVYDLRLFRDGQLVNQMPRPAKEYAAEERSQEKELRQWQETYKILDFQTGKKTITFRNILLPKRKGLKNVNFSAYAFNEDRVKSATARYGFDIPQNIITHKGRAYVIAVGVNAYENTDWNLRYAAKDAQSFSGVLSPLLKETGDYADVINVSLLSDWIVDQNYERTTTRRDASKKMFKAVLDVLSGRKVDPSLLSTIHDADKLKTVQPEDMVVIAYSSHGYADQSGVFYLFPYDIGKSSGKNVSADLLKHAISSDELSFWLRDIDAGDLVMIIDACHSAASIEGTGFKPGPMGSRGLGQLAYDKGMRILASTRADDVAWESSLTKQGLLSYALVQNGLVKKRADFDPQDRIIYFSEWLKYGAIRVPELYAEMRSGRIKGDKSQAYKLMVFRRGQSVDYEAEGKENISTQQPSLFDFRKTGRYEPTITRWRN